MQSSFAQQEKRDKGHFIESKNEYMDKIRESANAFREKKKEAKQSFKVDFSGMDLPDTISQFTRAWHNPPVSQGYTGTCWSFSTTSYFESEIYRVTGQKIKLSPIYTAYWEYVEKTRRFIRERGDSEFGEGSEANAVMRIWKKYGIVPLENYTGLQEGQEFHDHRVMFKEMKDYLNSLKTSNAWNEEMAIATIKSILNHYIGEPPTKIEYDGKTMTPIEFLKDAVNLNLDEYVDFMSLMEQPYYSKVEYKVPDNWWHSKEYYNIPLDDFMMILKRAVRKGYTVDLGGDTSEPGRDSHAEVAIVPTFDIPSEYIDENARQLRFSNKSTTDDHGIHVVGYMEKNGKDWFLIKDSGSSSHNGKNFGYYFYHEDYIKLKMMDIMVHKSIAEDVFRKF
jgi:bleomycin hydrolase